MPMTDTVADFLIRLKNASMVRKEWVDADYSSMREQIANLLKNEGYILDYKIYELPFEKYLKKPYSKILHEKYKVTDLSQLPLDKIQAINWEEYLKDGYTLDNVPKRKFIRVFLKYGPQGERVLREVKRVSKPGRRIYVGKDEIPLVRAGLGTVILATNKGLLPGYQARKLGVGGEVICFVW